jgi:glutathionyl-hydroquinone reductase
MYAVPWTSRKAFVRDLRKIEPGMSVSQADVIMSHYIFGSGWPVCPLPAS